MVRIVADGAGGTSGGFDEAEEPDALPRLVGGVALPIVCGMIFPVVEADLTEPEELGTSDWRIDVEPGTTAGTAVKPLRTGGEESGPTEGGRELGCVADGTLLVNAMGEGRPLPGLGVFVADPVLEVESSGGD